MPLDSHPKVAPTPPDGRQVLPEAREARFALAEPAALGRAEAGVEPAGAVDLGLDASGESFRLMVQSVQDYAILMLTPDGNVASWNVGAERFKGYRAEEIIGRHFSVFYPAQDIAAGKPERALAIAAAEGRLEDEGWRVRQDGTQFWANVVITALRDADGTLHGYGKVTRDRTEHRAQERAIRDREQLVTGVLAAATECSIIGTDLDGIITIFNTRSRVHAGLPADEMVGARNLASLHDPGELALCAAELGIDAGFAVLAAAARRGEAETREWTYVGKHGIASVGAAGGHRGSRRTWTAAGVHRRGRSIYQSVPRRPSVFARPSKALRGHGDRLRADLTRWAASST